MSFLASNNSRALSTNKLAKFLMVAFLVVAPMIVIWILCGQPNVMGLNWIVPIEGRYYLTATVGNQINNYATQVLQCNPIPTEWFNEFKVFHPLLTVADGVEGGLSNQQVEAILHFIPNWGTHYIFNPLILAPIFGVLVFNIILNIILSLTTKAIYLDIFPSFLAAWMGTFMLILCGLMPTSHGGNNPHQNYWNIAVYILGIAIIWIGSLILFNLLFNKIIIESRFADIYYEKLIRETKETETLKEKYRNEHSKYRKDEKDYVEL